MSSKKRSRITNPEPFLPLGSEAFTAKKRSKPPKSHQLHQKLVPGSVTSKILKEALLQQKEIEHEDDDDEGNNVSEQNLDNEILLNQLHGLRDTGDEEDGDEYDGLSEIRSQFGQRNFEDEIDEEDEKLLESFLSKDDTLADIIVEKLKEQDAQVSSGVQPTPELDDSIIENYKGVGKLLSEYTSGKIPKALKRVPSLPFWEDVLFLTEPEKWSPNAMYQATRIFASNMGDKKVEQFYRLVLLPRVREDIRKNKRLHFDLYQSLKKALYKPAAFNKGILLPLCEIISKLLAPLQIQESSYNLPLLIRDILHFRCKRFKFQLASVIVDAVTSGIWRERNLRWFKNQSRSAERVTKFIGDEIRLYINTWHGVVQNEENWEIATI